jgi:5-methylcytosine-specific restriction endonuclease McrA
MKHKPKGEYPSNWPEIAAKVKQEANYLCERCGHPNDPDHGYTLTVHHLDGDKSNNARWNLAALCQKCHLRIQGRVFLPQFYMFEHSAWFEPHVAGCYESVGYGYAQWQG